MSRIKLAMATALRVYIRHLELVRQLPRMFPQEIKSKNEKNSCQEQHDQSSCQSYPGGSDITWSELKHGIHHAGIAITRVKDITELEQRLQKQPDCS